MPSTLKAIDVGSSSISPSTTSTVASAARVALSKAYHYNNTILLPSLEERLHSPPTGAAASTSSSSSTSSLLGSEINSSTGLTSISHVASVVVSNFLPLTSASLSSGGGTADTRSVDDTTYSANSYTSASELTATSDSILSSSSSAAAAATASASLSSASSSILSASSEFYPSYSPPVVESLVASSAEDFSNNFRDLSFDIFDDNDNDLFGSPMPFDASENGLWNGRFVPPPPRPPFFVDEPVLSDGLTTCDLCSWAMPTKSTFIFEGTMEKASELGWPLTLTIVSILSAILGAIIMIAVVKCRRKKTSHQRSDTHVQWWSRNKRPNGNNNHLRRSNIYTAHPVDSIRGLQQPSSLSASSSMTAMTTAMTVAAAAAPPNSAATLPFYHHAAGQQHGHTLHQLPHSHSQHSHLAHHHHHQQQQQGQQYLDQEQHYFEHEHEYHQPQELQLQLHPANATAATTTTATLAHPPSYHAHGPQQQHQQQQHLHQHQHSGASMSSTSTSSMPSLSCMPLQRQLPERDQQPIHFKSGSQAPQHVLHMQQHKQREQQHQQQQQSEQSPDLHHDNLFHWPTATSLVTS